MKLRSHTLICRGVVTLLIIAMLTAFASCGKTPEETTAPNIPPTTTMDSTPGETTAHSTPEETTAPIPPRGSTAIVDKIFNSHIRELYQKNEKEPYTNNFQDAFVPLPGHIAFSDLAIYEIIAGDDDTVHTFSIKIWDLREFDETLSSYPSYDDNYIYQGKTLKQWIELESQSNSSVQTYVISLKENGKTIEEIKNDPEYIRLCEIYLHSGQMVTEGSSEYYYKNYMDGYQKVLDFFKSFGFEAFHDITDRAWQIKLFEAVTPCPITVTGTAENIQKLIEGNDRYRISLAYADENGTVLGNTVYTYNWANQTGFPVPYWVEERMLQKERN